MGKEIGLDLKKSFNIIKEFNRDNGVKLYNLQDGGYVICEFKPNSLKRIQMEKIKEALEESFGKSKVLMLPNTMKLFSYNKADIMKIIGMLKEFIELDDESSLNE